MKININTRLLEKRLARLERLIMEASEPSTKKVKPNLFSRKIEEVKAAIAEGLDVNSRDDKGRTPLGFACDARGGGTGEIIKILLDAGADPDKADNTRNCMELGLRRNNNDGAKYLALAGAKLYFVLNNFNYLTNLLIGDMVNESEFSQILEKNFSEETFEYLYQFNYIIDESWKAFKSKSILRKIVNIVLSRNKKWLTYLPYIRGRYSFESDYIDILISEGRFPCIGSDIDWMKGDKAIAKKIYDSADSIGDGSLEFHDVNRNLATVLNNISEWFGWPKANIANIMTQEFFNNQTAGYQWHLLEDIVVDDKIDKNLLSKLVTFRFKEPPNLDIIYGLAKSNDPKLTRIVCKKLRPYIKGIEFPQHLMYEVAKSDNEYLISFVIDMLGKSFTQRMAKSIYKSSAFINILNDIDIRTDDNRRDYNRSDLISRILKQIASDTINREVRTAIDHDPSILADEEIQDALDSADHSNITAKQLKAIYDRWAADTGNKSEYDM